MMKSLKIVIDSYREGIGYVLKEKIIWAIAIIYILIYWASSKIYFVDVPEEPITILYAAIGLLVPISLAFLGVVVIRIIYSKVKKTKFKLKENLLKDISNAIKIFVILIFIPGILAQIAVYDLTLGMMYIVFTILWLFATLYYRQEIVLDNGGIISSLSGSIRLLMKNKKISIVYILSVLLIAALVSIPLVLIALNTIDATIEEQIAYAATTESTVLILSFTVLLALSNIVVGVPTATVLWNKIKEN